MNQPIGKLYGISVGPGDPELITFKGVRLLQNADIIAFPAGISGKPGIAEQIIAPWLQPRQKTLALDFPYCQNPSILQQAWHIAAQRVWSQLAQGKNLAFACEGDISFYSTFIYLAQSLTHQHPCVEIQIIPGVSSPQAAAAALGIPLICRQQRLIILPALYAITDLETALAQTDVIILLKISSVYEQIWHILQQKQLLDSAWIVERATCPDQKIHTHLGNHPHLTLSYFSLMIIQASHEPINPLTSL